MAPPRGHFSGTQVSDTELSWPSCSFLRRNIKMAAIETLQRRPVS